MNRVVRIYIQKLYKNGAKKNPATAGLFVL